MTFSSFRTLVETDPAGQQLRIERVNPLVPAYPVRVVGMHVAGDFERGVNLLIAHLPNFVHQYFHGASSLLVFR